MPGKQAIIRLTLLENTPRETRLLTAPLVKLPGKGDELILCVMCAESGKGEC